MKQTALISAAVLFLAPLVASAQALQPVGNFVVAIGSIVNLAIPIALALALLVFFWGLVVYIKKPEGPEGRTIMTWGIIALFVMVSVWGIIHLMQSALGINPNDKTETAPTVRPY